MRLYLKVTFAIVGAEHTFFLWLTITSLVAVAVTTVTSSTIYGMDRRMRATAQLGQYQIERLLGRGSMGIGVNQASRRVLADLVNVHVHVHVRAYAAKLG